MIEPEELHPFTINTLLPDAFGYPKKFITGELKWDFVATSGGGRSSAESVKDLMSELAQLTRQGADLEERQTLLKTIFHNHYDISLLPQRRGHLWYQAKQKASH